MSRLFDDVSQRLAYAHEQVPVRTVRDPRLQGGVVLKPASVLIALTERENPGVLLIHRPASMRAHPGQVAFPGGQRDPGENATQTALREAEEELGIPTRSVRVIGTTDLYCTGTGYEITPVLGVVPADLDIHPNPAEVAQWFEAPLDFVLDPANHATRMVEHASVQHKVIEIDWQGHTIWGITGAILANLAKRLDWMRQGQAR